MLNFMRTPPEPRDMDEARSIYESWVDDLEDLYPHIGEEDEAHIERGYN